MLKSTSPGLIMVVAGTALMLATTMVHHRVNQSYVPIYADGFARTVERTQPPASTSTLLRMSANVTDTRDAPALATNSEIGDFPDQSGTTSPQDTARGTSLDEGLTRALEREPRDSLGTGIEKITGNGLRRCPPEAEQQE